MKKILQLGGKGVTASDSDGFVYDEAGFTQEKLEFLKDLKNNRRGRIKAYADKFKCAVYTDINNKTDWNPLMAIPADCAFPCATQNEVQLKDAQAMVKNGVQLLGEGANMPTHPDAIDLLIEHNVMYAPGKASNTVGVGTSGLEMAQNYMGSSLASLE